MVETRLTGEPDMERRGTRRCLTGLALVGGVACACLVAGCTALPETDSSSEMERVLAENLGDLDVLRAGGGKTTDIAPVPPLAEPAHRPIRPTTLALKGSTNPEQPSVPPSVPPPPKAVPPVQPDVVAPVAAPPSPPQTNVVSEPARTGGSTVIASRPPPSPPVRPAPEPARPIPPPPAAVPPTVLPPPPAPKVPAPAVTPAPAPAPAQVPSPIFDLPDLPSLPFQGEPVVSNLQVEASSGVTIQPDTVLWISVEEDPSLSAKYTVNEYSGIEFGYAGLVLLNDMSVDAAERRLRAVLEGRYLRKATVKVEIAKASYDRVGVSGAVMTPGMVKIGPGSTVTLNEALRRAGGLRLESPSARVKVIRGGLLSSLGPIAEGEIFSLITPDGRPSIPNLSLANNDLAYVFAQQGGPPVPGTGEKKVLLLGEVPRQGIVAFSENEPCTLLYLLFKVGDLPRFANTEAVRIVRRDPAGQEKEIKANAKKLLREGNPADDVVLENGDRVIIPERRISIL